MYRSGVMRVPSGTAPPLYLPARGARHTQEASHLSPVAHSMMLASGISLQVWISGNTAASGYPCHDPDAAAPAAAMQAAPTSEDARGQGAPGGEAGAVPLIKRGILILRGCKRREKEESSGLAGRRCVRQQSRAEQCVPARTADSASEACRPEYRMGSRSGADLQQPDLLLSRLMHAAVPPRRRTSTRSRWNRLYSGCSMAARGDGTKAKGTHSEGCI